MGFSNRTTYNERKDQMGRYELADDCAPNSIEWLRPTNLEQHKSQKLLLTHFKVCLREVLKEALSGKPQREPPAETI
jgi:hypothetical protein